MSEPVTVAFRETTRNPGHVRVSVFVGRNDGARGNSGELTLRTDEWDELQEAIRNNNGRMHVDILKPLPVEESHA